AQTWDERKALTALGSSQGNDRQPLTTPRSTAPGDEITGAAAKRFSGAFNCPRLVPEVADLHMMSLVYHVMYSVDFFTSFLELADNSFFTFPVLLIHVAAEKPMLEASPGPDKNVRRIKFKRGRIRTRGGENGRKENTKYMGHRRSTPHQWDSPGRWMSGVACCQGSGEEIGAERSEEEQNKALIHKRT
ncbi:hypothetical protein P4O66_012315, partial [Electrophorus voltai]